MSADAGARSASPYSTGGGGVVLEHQYGATLITALLTGDQLPELGDNAAPLSVRFQASAESPVDDLLVTGRTQDGGERRVSIGVRRAPEFVSSEQASVHLLAGFVRVVTGHWDAVRAGRWRLALATASRNTNTVEVSDLAVIARTSPDDHAFRKEVAQPGRWDQKLRKRLIHVDALVRAAADEVGADAAGIEAGELTWRLLSSLTMRELRLEGADTADRTAAVNRLRHVTRDRTAGAADALFALLAELAGRYAPAGALVTNETLHRDLSGVPLAGGPAPLATPMAAAVFITGARAASGAAPAGETPLGARWRAGEEGWLGSRRYLLMQDGSGLLRSESDPGGEHTRRQAVARQTDPEPATGHAFVWLRQAGRDLARERDLLTRVQPAPDAAVALPEVTHFDDAAGMVTLALSWPAERAGPPCQTAQARFMPGALDGWRLSLLLAGLRSLTYSLERLHRLGASHRNLEPQAIIVACKGEFVLRDLGLAAIGYRPGEGPASYQAPEQAFGARMPRPGPATDVYQLAAIAYHLITGRLPSLGTPAAPARHPALPDSVTGIVGAALAASPADRPRLREFRAELGRAPKSRHESRPMT